MTLLTRLVFVGLLCLLGACPKPPSSSSSSSQLQTKDLAKVDAASAGMHEQETCNPVFDKKVGYTQSNCQEDLVCLPDIYEPAKGTCRASCASEDDCAEGRFCQQVTSLGFQKVGRFCLPQQEERDGLCQALHDPNACAQNRSCLIGDVTSDGQSVEASHFLCRNTCPYGVAGAEKACAQGEQCIASDLEVTPNGPVGLCIRPISWATQSDLTGEMCNKTTDHRFCDQSLLKGLENPAQLSCVSLQDNEGICLAQCSAPALDLNGDGLLAKEEMGKRLSCPADYECNLDLSRKIGLLRMIKNKQNPTQTKVCDATKCEPNKPCPNECGPGDGECLSLPTQSGQIVNLCGAPMGTCQPVQK